MSKTTANNETLLTADFTFEKWIVKGMAPTYHFVSKSKDIPKFLPLFVGRVGMSEELRVYYVDTEKNTGHILEYNPSTGKKFEIEVKEVDKTKECKSVNKELYFDKDSINLECFDEVRSFYGDEPYEQNCCTLWN